MMSSASTKIEWVEGMAAELKTGPLQSEYDCLYCGNTTTVDLDNFGFGYNDSMTAKQIFDAMAEKMLEWGWRWGWTEDSEGWMCPECLAGENDEIEVKGYHPVPEDPEE